MKNLNLMINIVITSGVTHREEHKVLLVVLPDAVVHPGTVVVHLLDAAFAHTVGTLILG